MTYQLQSRETLIVWGDYTLRIYPYLAGWRYQVLHLENELPVPCCTYRLKGEAIRAAKIRLADILDNTPQPA